MDSAIICCYKNGNYYNPAYSHYGKIVNVVCDMCHIANLKVSIGYDSTDLCMKCVDIISKKSVVYNDRMNVTLMNQSSTRIKQPVTRMEQSMYDPGYESNLSYMNQNMY
jgi:hypothetical protein